MSDDSNWSEYSNLVLKELETLSTGIAALRDDLQQVKQELAKIQVKEDKVDELRAWKDKIDDVASPSQLKDAIKQIDDLKIFKTKAVTIFAFVQFVMAAIIWSLNVFG